MGTQIKKSVFPSSILPISKGTTALLAACTCMLLINQRWVWINLPQLHGGLLISHSVFAASRRWGQPFSPPKGSLSPFWDVESPEPQNFSACWLWFMNTECARPSAESLGSSRSTPWPAALNNSGVLATYTNVRFNECNHGLNESCATNAMQLRCAALVAPYQFITI